MSEGLKFNRTILSPVELNSFVRDGYIKVPDLIPPAIVEGTRRNIATAAGIDESDPSTWRNLSKTLGDLWDVTLPCWTPGIEAVATQLVGPHIAHGPKLSPYLRAAGKDPWFEGFIPVLSYPDGGPRVFTRQSMPGSYHVDGIDLVSHWPKELYLVVFAYLVDVKSYGGATVVIPGSHRQIFEHWLTNPEDAATKRVPDLPHSLPLPIEGQAGDVLFMHYLCAHSGSTNHDDHIRYGLNSSINVDPAYPYRPRRSSPAPDWTPLDRTLRTDNVSQGSLGPTP
jgi:hypothetical protein